MNKMSFFRRSVPFVLLVANLASAPALAQGNTKEAATHFQRAVELYNETDFTAALVEFKQAYALAPNVEVLYNIAQAQFQVQKYADALAAFQRYLEEGGIKHKAEAEQNIAVLLSRVGKLNVTTNVPGAEVLIDDESTGKTPFSQPLVISIGRRKVTAIAVGGQTVTKWVEVTAADNAPVLLQFEVTKEGTAKRYSPPLPLRATVGWVTTALLTAGATTTGVLALATSSKLENARASFPASKSDLDGKSSQIKTFALATDIMGAAALAAGGFSLYWTLSRPVPKDTVPKDVKVGVGLSGVKLVGSF